MEDLNELGALIKKDNPGEYDELDNTDLATRIKAKHPDSYQQYTDTGTLQKVNQIMDSFNLDKGVFGNWLTRRRAESQSKLLDATGRVQMQLLTQASAIADAVIGGQKRELELELFIAQHHYQLAAIQADMILLANATRAGLTVASHQGKLQAEWTAVMAAERLKLEQELRIQYDLSASEITHKTMQLQHGFDVAIKKLDHAHEEEMFDLETRRDRRRLQEEHDHEERMSRLGSGQKIKENRKMGNDDLKRNLKEWENKVRLGNIAKDPAMAKMAKAQDINKNIDNLLIDIDNIIQDKAFPGSDVKLLPETKEQMIDHRRMLIEDFKRQMSDEPERRFIDAKRIN